MHLIKSSASAGSPSYCKRQSSMSDERLVSHCLPHFARAAPGGPSVKRAKPKRTEVQKGCRSSLSSAPILGEPAGLAFGSELSGGGPDTADPPSKPGLAARLSPANLPSTSEGSISYACRGPSHTTAPCGCRARHVLYARTSRPSPRLQPATRTESADTMSSRFTGSNP